MILTTLELQAIKQCLFDKVLTNHGDVTPYAELYDKVNQEIDRQVLSYQEIEDE